MNALMALLTATSVLAHAVLGCCIHHAHGPSANSACPSAPASEQNHHRAGGHCCGHEQESEHDEPAPAIPHRGCDERNCVAVSVGCPTHQVKAASAAFIAVPLDDILAVSATSADYIQSAQLQHNLGPPIRPHLFHRVLLI